MEKSTIHNPSPILPAELWLRILRYVTVMPPRTFDTQRSSFGVHPIHQAEDVVISFENYSVSLVSRQWRSLTLEYLFAYLRFRVDGERLARKIAQPDSRGSEFTGPQSLLRCLRRLDIYGSFEDSVQYRETQHTFYPPLNSTFQHSSQLIIFTCTCETAFAVFHPFYGLDTFLAHCGGSLRRLELGGMTLPINAPLILSVLAPRLEWFGYNDQVHLDVDDDPPLGLIRETLHVARRAKDCVELPVLHTLQLRGRLSAFTRSWTIPSLQYLQIAYLPIEADSEWWLITEHLKVLHCSIDIIDEFVGPLSELCPCLVELVMRRGNQTYRLSGHPSLRRIGIQLSNHKENHRYYVDGIERFLTQLADSNAFPSLTTIWFYERETASLRDLETCHGGLNGAPG